MLTRTAAVITHLVLAFYVTVCDFHPLQETVLFPLSHSQHPIKAPLLHTHTHTQSHSKSTKSLNCSRPDYIFMKAINHFMKLKYSLLDCVTLCLCSQFCVLITTDVASNNPIYFQWKSHHCFDRLMLA